MESPHIYHQVRPLTSTTANSPSKPTEYAPRISSRHLSSGKNDDDRTRIGSHLLAHHHRSSGSGDSSGGGGSRHRSRSAHTSPYRRGTMAFLRNSSSRPLSASYAHRPLPPPPPPQRYHFGCLLRNSLPPMPPGLTAKGSLGGARAVQLAKSKSPLSAGDVKVILCVKMPNTANNEGANSIPCVSIDSRRKQVTLVHPAPSRRRFGLTAPKMFSFDAVFTQEDPLAEVCSTALTDAVYSVVHGTDSCVLCLGHAKTSKSETMLGSDASISSIGVIPCAIAWLFRLVEEQKEATRTRFSVRVSAVEVFGHDESFKDLLQHSALDVEDESLGGPAPSSYLRDSSPNAKARSVTCGKVDGNLTPAARLSQTMDKLTEVRAPTAGHAAHLLDVALANRAQNVTISHTLLTLHVYQYKVEKTGSETEVSGGRSRLQLLYLGCGRYSSKETGQGQEPNPNIRSLSLANIANVLLGLLTGQRQLPHRESAVTQLLREGMTGNHTQPCIIAHVSGQEQHYSETLQVVQLASRLHRLRRRRVGSSGGSSAGGSSWSAGVGGTTSDSSASSRSLHSRFSVRPRLGRSSFGTSTTDYTSSSEQSCAGDTVIYLGSGTSETTSSLGPRGLADGSVVHSADEWQKYASSGEEQHFISGTKTRHGRSLSQSDGGTLRPGGLIKRVTPRTNATAWPRAAAVRKGKEVVSSTEETWVDGPNAKVTKNQQNLEVPTANRNPPPPPAPPYFGVAHQIVPQQPFQVPGVPKVFLTSTETTQVSSPDKEAPAPAEIHVKEPTYASIDDSNTPDREGNEVGSRSSSSSSSCSVSDEEENEPRRGERRRLNVGGVGSGGSGAGVGGGRGFGVLSDISEHTEETEGGTSAPSSIVGDGHEECENTLLDLAIQKSSLVHEGGHQIMSIDRTINWCLGEKQEITFLQSTCAALQIERKEPPDEVLNTPVIEDVDTPIQQPPHQRRESRGSRGQPPCDDHLLDEQKAASLPNGQSDHLGLSSRRKKHSGTASSSFERVAAWVKDVSTDLGQTQEESMTSRNSSHAGSRSPSSHRSCCTRKHRNHRKRRHRRHHSHRENSCSKCAYGVCALCEAEGKSCSRTCRKCSYCEDVCSSGDKRASEPSNHGSSCSLGSKREVPFKSHHSSPQVVQTQRQGSVLETSTTSQESGNMPRTVSFPRMPVPIPRSSTTLSSPCQPHPAIQPYWPQPYAPHPLPLPPPIPMQPAPMPYCNWSLPTSPYLHSSMKAWSAQIPTSASAASDLSSAKPLPQQYNYTRRSSDLVDPSTPAHGSTASGSATAAATTSTLTSQPQEPKKSRFFTLPSIFCTFRRWQERRKERRMRKLAEAENEAQFSEASEDVTRSMSATPMRSSASLPGAYSHSIFLRGPSSDQGIRHTPQYYAHFSNMAQPTQAPFYQPTQQTCVGDPNAFVSQMQLSLSTYRTGNRTAMAHKDHRGSSGYESCRQGVPSVGTGAAGGSSEVSSAHTDSVDSCSSGYQQPHQQQQYSLQQQNLCCSNQRFYTPKRPFVPLPQHPLMNPVNQVIPSPMVNTGRCSD